MNSSEPQGRLPRPAGGGRRRTLAAAWTAGLALLVACVAAGCGPGLGGTGTGAHADALAAYGAREVPVCAAEFADLLGCAAASPGASPQPASGARFFAEASPASRVLLEIDGQEAQLRLRCLDLVFIGSFGQVGTAAPAFYGQAIEGGSRARLASLQVERSAAGLTVTLFDAAGRTIAGPQGLVPVGGSTSAAPCP
jgi:hypothetical protein